MNRLSILVVLTMATAALGQPSNPTIVPTSPPVSCSSGIPLWAVYSTGTLYICNNGTPTAIGGGGGDGVTSFTGDGTIFNNSASTGAVTATLAHTPTGSGSVVLATSPSISGLTVTSSFTATGLVTLADLAIQATNTVLGNATSGTASPTALAVGTCSTASSALIWTTNTGFGCNTSITANAVPAANLTGATLASGVTASSLTSLGGGTVGTAAFVNTGTSGATIPLLNGVNTFSGANTFSAAQTISAAGAASTSPLMFTGSLETGGSGTTNFPHLFIQPTAATASTHWSANGTGLGMNMVSGFSGNFLDFEINGAGASYAVSNAGVVSAAGMNSTSSTWSIAANVDALKLANTAWMSWSSTAVYSGTQDTGLDRSAAGVVEVNLGTALGSGGSLKATGIIAGSYQQIAASNSGGTCAMVAGTSCTITIGHTYTTPVCIVTQQSATLTGGASGCTVSGTTVTITSAVLNSETWGAFVFGNPN